jgi:hypothetical protein
MAAAMSVIHTSSGPPAAPAGVAQPDGAVIVHAGGGPDALPGIAATTWAIARTGAFEQLVFDASPATGAAQALLELRADAAVVRVDGSRGLLGALQDALVDVRCIAVVVHADDDAGLAIALAASRLGISLVRVGGAIGAGGPARVISRLADLQFVAGADDARALRSQVAPERLHVVGNPGIDAVRRFARAASRRAAWRRLGLEPGTYTLAALSGAAPVPEGAGEPLVIEAPPAWDDTPARALGAHIVRAPGYVDHLSLLQAARTVVTDSPRVRDEAAALGVRHRGPDEALEPAEPLVIPLWDGRAGARITRVLVANFARVRYV